MFWIFPFVWGVAYSTFFSVKAEYSQVSYQPWCSFTVAYLGAFTFLPPSFLQYPTRELGNGTFWCCLSRGGAVCGIGWLSKTTQIQQMEKMVWHLPVDLINGELLEWQHTTSHVHLEQMALMCARDKCAVPSAPSSLSKKGCTEQTWECFKSRKNVKCK